MWFEIGGLLRTDMSKTWSNQIDDNEIWMGSVYFEMHECQTETCKGLSNNEKLDLAPN